MCFVCVGGLLDPLEWNTQECCSVCVCVWKEEVSFFSFLIIFQSSIERFPTPTEVHLIAGCFGFGVRLVGAGSPISSRPFVT
jgi:hypothetical protein